MPEQSPQGGSHDGHHQPSHGMADWERRWREYLSEHGLRLTRQRRLIAEAFFQTEGHPSTEELYNRVRALDERIGQATLYRTLNLLVDSGLASSHRFGGSATRYEAASVDEDDHHDHLICERCGRIMEFRNDAIERLQQQVAAEHDFEMTDHKMEIYGLCARCR